MKILVTGACGFIGSNISERLVKDGHDVECLDNMHTGAEANIESIRGRVKLHKKSAGEIASMGEQFDAILHQGVYSSSPMYKENPHLTAKVLDEWISVLEFVRKNPCRLVYASSSSLYNGNAPPHREDMGIKATDFYTEGRYSMERVAKLYSDFYGVKSVGLRYFSVYGPHERSKGRYANLITQFLWEMKEGKSPVLLGDGKQTRDFTYVDDVVEANVRALEYAETDVFNVGTGKSASLNEVVSLLNSKLKTSIPAEYRPNTIKNYVQHTLADTAKAKSRLGFAAKIGLEQGVENIIRHYYP
ncbi:NAD-dependent epimerase/dehydratase family protein [Candidatus Micrarchaeota archaeon]|nr:NAD-dependent epimerase/dehydratase family protein [Candidatus Micrarchaeota archaeon]